MGSDQTLPKLPIIDFSEENLKPGSISWLSTSKEVQCALEEYGCFVAVYKQVPLQLHHAMIHALEELMDLPSEAKVQNDDSLIHYFQPSATMPLIKGFRLKNPTTLEATQRFTDVMWPTGHDSFCETALSFSKLISKLHQMVLRMVFESYGVEKHYESHIASTTYHMGLVRYRPSAMDEINVGRTAHTDKGIINILDQNLVKALEIELKDGNWITFEPAPSHFVVFAGDAFLAWSNGRIHSPNHRVIIRGNEAKYTVSLNSYISDMVETPEELVDDEHPMLFKPFSHSGFLQYTMQQPEKTLKDYCGV